jgi:hypothetical protein
LEPIAEPPPSTPDYVVFEVLIPRTDGCTGEVHRSAKFDEWVLETAGKFGGITVLALGVFGLWFRGLTPIEDHSNWYRVGVSPDAIPSLMSHIRETAGRFGQECIYLQRCGEAWLVKPK